jgi:ribose 5-phosphate isomerase B
MSFVFDHSKPIAIGSDHAGVDYKAQVKTWLESQGYTVKDFGTYNTDSVDYPDFAHPTATSVEQNETSFGILFCGSANGVAMTANKHAGIRAGLCWKTEVAELVGLILPGGVANKIYATTNNTETFNIIVESGTL